LSLTPHPTNANSTTTNTNSGKMAGAGYKLCGPRAARRYLILVNMVIAFAGLLYIVVGAISLAHGALPRDAARARYNAPKLTGRSARCLRAAAGEGFKKAVNEFCEVECDKSDCQSLSCSGHLPSCDCSKRTTSVPGYFYAPASGLIAVGVFSLLTPLVGCIAAIRHEASLLCFYITAASLVVVLQVQPRWPTQLRANDPNP
jgi:hypothetical protein